MRAIAILDKVVSISELGQRKLWVIWGKSNSGKTWLSSTFPKPLLYVQIGDDGANTIAKQEDIDAIRIQNIEELKNLCKELQKDKKYTTIIKLYTRCNRFYPYFCTRKYSMKSIKRFFHNIYLRLELG